MSRLASQLAAGEFVVTAEVAPPKGVDLAVPLAIAEQMSNLVTAVNVTDNQGANMRMTPLAMAVQLVQAGVEPVLQLTCRDRNRMALQSDLLGAAALGVENLLLLTGDHARFGDHPEARSVFDLDSVQLLQVVTSLNAGRDLSGCPLSGCPRFFAGAAVNPATEPFELMFRKVEKKAAGGACFFQTQAVFDLAALERFMLAMAPLDIPVILGVLLVRSPRMAQFLNRHIPGVRVPDSLIANLDASADPLAVGVAAAREMVAAARQLCQGVHLMTLGHDELIPELLA